ncbi:GAF domain-containing protein [Mycobacterium sp. NPDC050441]|uniref:sensor histidine kinase n=1 Tax=Mycobacterium sp. NPDC050441 TaxID=3155403 RepID=UPI0033F3AA21
MTTEPFTMAAESRPGRTRHERLLAVLLRPTTPPVKWGIVTAVVLIALEVATVSQLKRIAPDNAFGAVFLFGVLVVSAGWGFRLAIAMSVASTLAYSYFHAGEGPDNLAPAIVVFLTLALLTNILVGQARLRAVESEQRRREADRAADLARTMLQGSAALRRIATLVARRVEPADLYQVVVDELGRGLDIHHATLLRYEPDSHAVVLASRQQQSPDRLLPAGDRLPLDEDTVVGRIARSGAPARVTTYQDRGSAGATGLDDLGMRSAAGAPILVGDRVWGALIAGRVTSEPLPEDTEVRINDFADLVATAIYNAETRAELTASRARIVTAADQARRGFERDLHDGAQQRIVSLGLELRAIEAMLPHDDTALRPKMGTIVDSLSNLHTDLQELSRGLHPAVLSRGGLGPALKTLARRSPVPVHLTVELTDRMAESIEVAGYYLVAESLTNAAKYARANEVVVHAAADEAALHIEVSDDGVGGANPAAGSGLIGLKDRVEALSGHFEVTSPSGDGTIITARIPLSGNESPRST